MTHARNPAIRRVSGVVLAATLLLTACASNDDNGDDGSAADEPSDTAEDAADDDSGAQDDDGAGGDVGPAEQTEITVALPFPDFTMFSFYLVGNELGYYEDEGLSVEIITADDVVAAVSSDSADVGVDSAGSVIDASGKGVGVSVLSGHFCRQNFDFAAQPDVTDVSDLEGENVVLAGTSGDPAQFEREIVLEQEGWDLDEVDHELVYPGPDSAAWREFLIADRVELIPFYDDDQAALEEYGANIVVNTIRNWPNDLHLVREDWTEENPNTAVRFLRATMKAAEFIAAPGVGEVPENKDEVLDILAAADFDVEELRESESPWAVGGHFICPNLYFDETAWNDTIERQQLDSVAFDEHVDLTPLTEAQSLLGLDNSPPSDVEYP